jgi:hypothetical protein
MEHSQHIGGEEHMYIVVPTDQISDVHTRKPVIVDGAMDQFCTENKDKIFVTIGSKEDLPTVAVLTEHDKRYSYYYQESNW